MKNIKFTLITIMVLMYSSVLVADSSKTNLVIEYLKLSKTKETIEISIKTYVEQMILQYPKANKNKLEEYFNSYMGWDVLREPSIKIISSKFTNEELQGINDFYKSKIGQSFSKNSPIITKELSIVTANNLFKLRAKEKNNDLKK